MPRKERKGKKKKEVRKANHNESRDEGCMKLTLQARNKIPALEKGSIDKYIAESQQIREQIPDTGYSVPAPMKCATLIRGSNLTDTQVHPIASRLSIRAVDLEEQTVEASRTSKT